jgi:hypothetical protein
MTEIVLSLNYMTVGHYGIWRSIEQWLIADIGPSDYKFSERRSYINGITYPASIIFNKEEDATIFALKFQKAIKYICNPS